MPHAPLNSQSTFAKQFRLLYVGNDEDLILSLRQLLTRPKYQVVTCPDRQSAETFSNSDIQYDLFILDHEMRDRAAFDLTRLIRSLEHREQSQVMVVGGGEDSLRQFTRASGGNAYVAKEKEFSAIHRAVGRLLAESLRISPTCEPGTASRPDAGS